ncbi:MAG: DUF2085 domain-containing protein [Candidatus Thermoplasmatota archaeon]|nr:DUF2085 domain-containing protein [Candidatus Thermoplasmatota archaeon]
MKCIKTSDGEIILGEGLWRTIEHNKKSHSIKVNYNNKEHYLCARCTGTYLGISIAILLSLLLTLFSIPFFVSGKNAFIVAWLMAMPSIIDWSTSKVGFRTTNNHVRMCTGIMLGTGIVVYFWTGWHLTVLLATLILYQTSFTITINTIYLMKKGYSLTDIFIGQKNLMKHIWVNIKKRLGSYDLHEFVHDERAVSDELCLCLLCGACCCCGCCACAFF